MKPASSPTHCQWSHEQKQCVTLEKICTTLYSCFWLVGRHQHAHLLHWLTRLPQTPPTIPLMSIPPPPPPDESIFSNGCSSRSCAVVDDNSTDDEEGRIARFLSQGCKCQLNDGSPCSALFNASQVMAARDQCRQLTWDQLDVMIMGQLSALCQIDPLTQKTKTKNTDRTRTATLFHFGGHRICQMVFLFLHALSNKRFKAIKKNWRENGLCPRVRSKVVPHNTTKLSDIHNVVRFILQYADENAILLPARIPGDAAAIVHYQVAGMGNIPPVVLGSPRCQGCYLLFCDLWNQLTPQITVTHPMSDLCWVCQQNSNLIMRAHNRPVEEKSEVHVIIHVCNIQHA